MRFLTPGPSQLHPRVSSFIQEALDTHICSLSHRSTAFKKIYANAEQGIRKLLNLPETHTILFLSSATEAMERILENLVNTHSVHLVNGAFSQRFYDTAVELQKSPEKIDAEFGKGFTLEQIHVPEDTELICVTQNETSSGVQTPIELIHKLKKKHPQCLLAVDIVSSFPYVQLDFGKVDCAFFSVQKGLGMPAGLGILVLNERCMQKAMKRAEAGAYIGSYHSFPAMLKKAKIHQTVETPNVLGLFLLGKVCSSLLEQGIERIRAETDEKAKRLYAFFDSHPTLKPLVQVEEWRSRTVITVKAETSTKSIEMLKAQGITVGSGYGNHKEEHIRIANFPAHTLEDIDTLISLLS